LVSGQPILAIGEAREVVKLLSGLRDCCVIDGVNAQDTARSLHALLMRHTTDRHNFRRRQERLDVFSRRRLAGKLSDLLDGLIDGSLYKGQVQLSSWSSMPLDRRYAEVVQRWHNGYLSW
jgi:hypothetical protein